jgi:cytochrome P450
MRRLEVGAANVWRRAESLSMDMRPEPVEPPAPIPRTVPPENRDKLHRFQYLPFGAGPRTRIGATFALQEAVIALGVMMKRFRFDMTPETKPWPVQRLTTQPRGGLPLRVSAR